MKTTYRFNLPEIMCVNCVAAVEQALDACPNPLFQSRDVNLVANSLSVEVEGGASAAEVIDQIHKTLRGAGHACEYVDLQTLVKDEVASPAQAVALGQDATAPEPQTPDSRLKQLLRSHWLRAGIGLLFGFAFLALSLTGVTLPFLAIAALGGLSVLLTIALGWESYREAFYTLTKTRTLTMDSLFALSTITVIVVSVAAMFVPWLPMMFDAGLLIFGFRHLGKGIEESIKQSMALTVTFHDLLPKSVMTERGERPLASIQPGEVIVLSSGHILPVDAVCLDEQCVIDESRLTGATWPRLVAKGAALQSGVTLAPNQPRLRFQVSARVEGSYLAELDKQIEAARREKAPLETETKKILQYFIPSVIAIAILSAVILGILFPPSIAIQCAVAVLVSACPCTLGFITPLSLFIGMRKAAKHDVRFTSEKALQDAGQISAVVFDINGTLTTGTWAVDEVQSLVDDRSSDDIMQLATSLEAGESHPAAAAILQHGQSLMRLDVLEKDRTRHTGVKGQIKGKSYVLGNEEMMRAEGIDISMLSATTTKPGSRYVYLAQENKLVGYIALTDPLRPNALLAMNSLKQLGKTIYLCTGADATVAARYATTLGISQTHVLANCTPEEKAAHIQTIKRRDGTVAMIGDAGNDAAAVAASDFSIAVESTHGDDVTKSHAGAIVRSGSLLPIVSAFAISKQTVSNIRQNLGFSLGYNMATLLIASGVLLAVGFMLNPAVGVALMILQSSLLLWNAYRFKEQELPHLKAAEREVVARPDTYAQLSEGTPRPSASPCHEPEPPAASVGLFASRRPVSAPPAVTDSLVFSG